MGGAEEGVENGRGLGGHQGGRGTFVGELRIAFKALQKGAMYERGRTLTLGVSHFGGVRGTAVEPRSIVSIMMSLFASPAACRLAGRDSSGRRKSLQQRSALVAILQQVLHLLLGGIRCRGDMDGLAVVELQGKGDGGHAGAVAAELQKRAGRRTQAGQGKAG